MNLSFTKTKGLRTKLMGMVVLPVILMAGVGFLALSGLRSQRADLHQIARERLKLTQYSGRLGNNMHSMTRLLYTAIAEESESARKLAMDDALAHKTDFTKTMGLIHGLNSSDQGREYLTTARLAWESLDAPMEEVIASIEAGGAENDLHAKKVMLSTFGEPAKAIAETLRQADLYFDQSNEEIVQQSESNSDWIFRLTTGGVIAGSLLLFTIGFLLARHLSGTLTLITRKIQDSSEQVGGASSQLSAASLQLSSSATEGAASLEETIASIDQLSDTVTLNAAHAKEAAQLSSTSSKAAADGESEIRRLVEAMSEISKSSKQIEEIISVIDDIAFQTNLLALNAAVEAARAGDQGKGFAVVAEAVRNLAQRSAASAKDINALIKDAVIKTENGSRIADQSGSVLSNIVTSVRKIASLNAEISDASDNQSRGLAEINRAMKQLDTVTQNNAASAEEASASSEELSAQSRALEQLVFELTTVVYGDQESSNAAEQSPSAAPLPSKIVTNSHTPLKKTEGARDYADARNEF